MNALADALAGDARLVILKELVQQVDGRLSLQMLQRVLDAYGVRRDRDWIVTQLRKLEALGAIELTQSEAVMVARITRAGRDHVEERSIIEGVTRPADTY